MVQSLGEPDGEGQTPSCPTEEEAWPERRLVLIETWFEPRLSKAPCCSAAGLELQQGGLPSTRGWELVEKEDNLCQAGSNDSGVSKECFTNVLPVSEHVCKLGVFWSLRLKFGNWKKCCPQPSIEPLKNQKLSVLDGAARQGGAEAPPPPRQLRAAARCVCREPTLGIFLQLLFPRGFCWLCIRSSSSPSPRLVPEAAAPPKT